MTMSGSKGCAFASSSSSNASPLRNTHHTNHHHHTSHLLTRCSLISNNQYNRTSTSAVANVYSCGATVLTRGHQMTSKLTTSPPPVSLSSLSRRGSVSNSRSMSTILAAIRRSARNEKALSATHRMSMTTTRAALGSTDNPVLSRRAGNHDNNNNNNNSISKNNKSVTNTRCTVKTMASNAQKGKIHPVSEKDFSEEVLDADVPVLVDFWAQWCGPCKLIDSVVGWAQDHYGSKLKVRRFLRFTHVHTFLRSLDLTVYTLLLLLHKCVRSMNIRTFKMKIHNQTGRLIFLLSFF